jgi:hypothetical protein
MGVCAPLVAQRQIHVFVMHSFLYAIGVRAMATDGKHVNKWLLDEPNGAKRKTVVHHLVSKNYLCIWTGANSRYSTRGHIQTMSCDRSQYMPSA